METLKTVISASISFFEEIQLSKDLSQLRISLPIAHIVINCAEWGRFKDKNLALLLSQLKDTICDAEDLLREFNDQELGQKMEDNHRNRAGQLISSSYNLAKSFLIGSKTRLKEAQSKLDKVVGDTEAALNLMGLNVELAQLGKQLMPETSSVVGVSQVFGRDEERDLVIEKLGVIIGRDNERDHALTRFPNVAKIVSTLDPIELEGLPTDIFWEFFKKCAFNGQNPELYPQLQDIGRSIADRLLVEYGAHSAKLEEHTKQRIMAAST